MKCCVIVTLEKHNIYVPYKYLQASTGHRSFTYIFGKGGAKEGIQLVAMCNLTARCH